MGEIKTDNSKTSNIYHTVENESRNAASGKDYQFSLEFKALLTKNVICTVDMALKMKTLQMCPSSMET